MEITTDRIEIRRVETKAEISRVETNRAEISRSTGTDNTTEDSSKQETDFRQSTVGEINAKASRQPKYQIVTTLRVTIATPGFTWQDRDFAEPETRGKVTTAETRTTSSRC